MKVLIIEDDKYKSSDLDSFLRSYFDEVEIVLKESLSSGLFEVEENPDYDMLLLDMSMPSFDKTNKDPSGGSPESYAGDEFLAHMSLMQISIPVIVVTQYDNFGPDENQKSLEALKTELERNYSPIYVGTVFYQINSLSWHRSLRELLRKAVK